MCSREFHMSDSLKLWDAMFLDYYNSSESNPLIMLDCICLSMLVYVKPQIMTMNDQTYVLQRLLKYPPVESLDPILELAFKYRNQMESLEEEPVKANEIKKDENKKAPILFNTGLSVNSYNPLVKGNEQKQPVKQEPIKQQEVQEKPQKINPILDEPNKPVQKTGVKTLNFPSSNDIQEKFQSFGQQVNQQISKLVFNKPNNQNEQDMEIARKQTQSINNTDLEYIRQKMEDALTNLQKESNNNSRLAIQNINEGLQKLIQYANSEQVSQNDNATNVKINAIKTENQVQDNQITQKDHSTELSKTQMNFE